MSETYDTAGPRCPYCFHLHRADDQFFYDDKNTGMECEECGETFTMEITHSTSWRCAEIEA